MVDSWPEVRLGDHIDLLSGFAFKSKNFTNDPDDIPLVKGANVHQGYVDWVNAVRWPREDLDQFEKYHLEPGDVVLAMDRPWIEAGLKYSWIKPKDPISMLVQRVSRMRGINGLKSRYLRYVIGSPQFTNYIKPIVTGVNVPHISGTQIKDYKFFLPPEECQDTFSDILEPYDTLIENNNHRIAILEDMAQSLYHEWFIKFRFPDHEMVELKDSPLGEIPEGWENKRLDDYVVLQRGFDLPKKQRNEDGRIPIYAASGINGYHDVAKVKPPGLVTGRSGTLGVVNLILEDFWPLNTSLWVKEFKNCSAYYGYYLLKSIGLEQFNSGAAVPTLNRNDVHGLNVIAPPKLIIDKFESVVESMFSQIEVLTKKNNILKAHRDLLLPKIISGNINLRD